MGNVKRKPLVSLVKTTELDPGVIIVACALPIGITINDYIVRGPRHVDVEPPEIVKGVKGAVFAITRHIPKQVWDDWYQRIGRHLDAVQTGQLFAHENWGELLTMCHEASPAAPRCPVGWIR